MEKKIQLQQSKSCRFLGNDGLTIIEVLIALAIFSVGVLAVAKLQTYTIRNNTRANVITQATMLAQTRMDELKSFDDLDELLLENSKEETGIDEFGDPGGVFTRKTSVDTPINDLSRRIKVTVTWNSPWEGHNKVELTSLTQGNGI